MLIVLILQNILLLEDAQSLNLHFIVITVATLTASQKVSDSFFQTLTTMTIYYCAI